MTYTKKAKEKLTMSKEVASPAPLHDVVTPRRVQRKRTKGWKMSENTVCVTRPGKWGNPFDTATEFAEAIECCSIEDGIPRWMDEEKGKRIMWMVIHMTDLRGKNLACFCSLDKLCHADHLLAWANASG